MFLMVAIIPEAIPRFEPGTAPIIALLLGVWNKPIPNPIVTNPAIINKKGESAFKKLSSHIPPEMMAIPAELIYRLSIRSDKLPLTGATIMVVNPKFHK